MADKHPRKKEGFEGQKLIVVPKKVVSGLAKDPIACQAYVTDIGYYPKARFHYMGRATGIQQHILIYCVEGSGWVDVENRRL